MMLPKITFGIIVLNGEPFTRYNLRALYPFAHEIIVVEGAAPAAASIATPDGHSVDGTLQTLLDFKAYEDPENKLTIVTAEDEGYPNGFWPGEKHEQSQAYAKRATGNWLWQVDVDEFYLPKDMAWIIGVLSTNQSIYAVSFKQIQFWGGLNYYTDGWYLRHYGGDVFHRLFRWAPGYTYVTHRPPTVINEKGVDLRALGHLQARELARRNIFLYHYSLVFPHQVIGKSAYYSQVSWGKFGGMSDWATENFLQLKNPYRVHNVYRYPSWLERYTGPHPPQVIAMWDDLKSGSFRDRVQIRDTGDIERLLISQRYRLGIAVLKLTGVAVNCFHTICHRIVTLLPISIKTRVRSIRSKEAI